MTQRLKGPLVVVIASGAVALGCAPAHRPVATSTTTSTPTTTTTTTTAPVRSSAYPDPGPVMGPSRLSAQELASWVDSVGVGDARPPVPVRDIARYFIEEGAREGVAGDVAFAQAILETGWFRFSERMPPSHNNFSGIGAVDGGASSARFPDARTGVRAQIQHLRAYADATVDCSNFATPTVTPRCRFVIPKGKAPGWSDMGNGNWATDPGYAEKIASLYDRATRHARDARGGSGAGS